MKDLKVFGLISIDFDIAGNQFVQLIYAFGVTFNCKRRARLVGNIKITIELHEGEVQFRVVSTYIMRTALLLVMLNNLKVLASDILSSYLMEHAKDKMYARVGPAF